MTEEDVAGLLPLVLLLAVAYFLLIRPARRRAREAQQLQAALSIGDEVMMTSGILGRIVGVDTEHVELDVANGTVLRVHRGSIGKILTDNPAADAPLGESTDDPGSTIAGPATQPEPGADHGDAPDDRSQGAR